MLGLTIFLLQFKISIFMFQGWFGLFLHQIVESCDFLLCNRRSFDFPHNKQWKDFYFPFIKQQKVFNKPWIVLYIALLYPHKFSTKFFVFPFHLSVVQSLKSSSHDSFNMDWICRMRGMSHPQPPPLDHLGPAPPPPPPPPLTSPPRAVSQHLTGQHLFNFKIWITKSKWFKVSITD